MAGASPTYGVAIFPSYAPTEFCELCAHVDALGFDYLWLPDERFFRDVGVQLTLAAMSTRRVQIGTAVTDPYIRHPALTASLMASVDEVAEGRVTVGIGAGVSGFKALGVQQERPQLAIREAIALMRTLWRHEGPVEMEGKTTRFVGAGLDFAPRRREMPVWIAGRGPAVLALAGEVAQGVMIGGLASEPGLAYANAQVSRGLAKAGRDSASITRALWLHTGVADDGQLARAAVRTIVAGVLVSSLSVLQDIGIPLPDELVRSLQGVTYGVNNPEMQRIAESLNEEVLRHFSVAGTPSEVGERLRQLGEAGIDHVAVVPWLAEGQTLSDFLDKLAEAR
jgi:5,10-methylenetetrahydromethanopterin reductase